MASTLAELVAWLKQNPDKASAASVGNGSAAHLCAIALQERTGTRFQIVPYRGGAPAIQDLIAGRDLIRGGHYGQRSYKPRQKAGQHGCTDRCCNP